MPETILIQVRFTRDTKYGTFNDALYYTQEEYDALKDGDKEAAQQARADAYVATIDNQKNIPPVELTIDELQQDKSNYEKYLAETKAKLVEKGVDPATLDVAADDAEVKP